jgi:predicted TPR repeat methyltransferase
MWRREQIALKCILQTYLKDRNIDLLDFACGTGRILALLENFVDTAVGVDVSTSMLAEAKKKLKQTELIQADIIADNILYGRKFDLITAFRFFLNAEPSLRQVALKCLSQLLKEDGYLVFNNHRNQTSPLVRFKYNRRHNRRNFMSIEEMHALVDMVGLKIIRMYPIGCLPLPKVSLPASINSMIDKIGARFESVHRFSESLIAVCRFA